MPSILDHIIEVLRTGKGFRSCAYCMARCPTKTDPLPPGWTRPERFPGYPLIPTERDVICPSCSNLPFEELCRRA